jgi:AcrR family transcriptional regulator
MTANRGFASTNSESRKALIAATADLLANEGAHAFSARRVAEKAGLKPQLVHYYFRSMDELLVATFRESSQEYLAIHNAALAERQPLRALWRINTDRPDTKRSMGYLALAPQYAGLRHEMLLWGEHFRKMQIAMIGDVLARSDADPGPVTPAALAMMMASICRTIVMEDAIGIHLAHAELAAVVEQFLDRIEPLDMAE